MSQRPLQSSSPSVPSSTTTSSVPPPSLNPVALDNLKNVAISILPGSLSLSTSSTNPPASFIFNYVKLYESQLIPLYDRLSMDLPILKINLSKELLHQSGSPTVIQNANERLFFEEWLSSILESGKVLQVNSEDCCIISPHLVVNSGGKLRVVGNFKGLNRLTLKDQFKGPSISEIVPFCAAFLFHTKIDLKLGFNNVKVDPNSKPLLSFQYGNAYYQYQVMPLGISSGPFTFDLWAKLFCNLVQPYLQSKVKYYQDDFLLNDNDPLRLYHSTLIFAFLLMTCANSIINWEKSTLIPSPSINALGAEISYHFYSLSNLRRLHAIQRLSSFLSSSSATFHQFQIIIGLIESIAMIEKINVQEPHSFLSNLSSSSPAPSSVHKIPPPLRASVATIISHLQPLSLFVDASKSQAGAILFMDQEILWTFSCPFNINDNGSTYREALALHLALMNLPIQVTSPFSRLIINTDNIGLFHCLLNKSSDSRTVQIIINDIISFVNSSKLAINYKFISGILNPADFYSRVS